MSLNFSVIHKTTYQYELEALESYSRIKISPLQTLCQDVKLHIIEVKPDVPIFKRVDYYGNVVHEFSVPFRHKSLEIVAKSEVTTYIPSQEPLNSQITIEDAALWFKENEFEFFDYIHPSSFTPITKKVIEEAQRILHPKRKLTEAIIELNHWFTTDFKYKSGSTTINTPIDEVLEKRQGVCQDFAHTMIAMLRSAGIASRYVSGYIETTTPGSIDGMIGSEQSHAWLDVYIPYYSWFGIDPTNDMYSSERHVRVAVGRDFEDVSPVRGFFKSSGKQTLYVEVQMRRITTHDTKPKLQEHYQ